MGGCVAFPVVQILGLPCVDLPGHSHTTGAVKKFATCKTSFSLAPCWPWQRLARGNISPQGGQSAKPCRRSRNYRGSRPYAGHNRRSSPCQRSPANPTVPASPKLACLVGSQEDIYALQHAITATESELPAQGPLAAQQTGCWPEPQSVGQATIRTPTLPRLAEMPAPPNTKETFR